MIYPLVRPVLFSLDPERAHKLALRSIELAARFPRRPPSSNPVTLMGLTFPNRVGLAAGFDKNAEAVDGLGQLGFGFIEVGTVTPRPQKGQPPPRLFRHPQFGALINRLGFPNVGAAVVARRLRRRRYPGVLGVNISKNADTPMQRAVDDYVSCLRTLHAVADYIVVNVSSPNTAALRDLHDPARLRPLLSDVLAERDRLLRGSARRLPVLLKISPDLEAQSLAGVADAAKTVALDGFVATNTTVQRIDVAGAAQAGGLSGAPLHRLSLSVVAELRRLLGPSFPIIGVGGIDSVDKGIAMRAAGADLIQIYTGLVYRGPALPRTLARRIV